jgi:hypothetical protein
LKSHYPKFDKNQDVCQNRNNNGLRESCLSATPQAIATLFARVPSCVISFVYRLHDVHQRIIAIMMHVKDINEAMT